MRENYQLIRGFEVFITIFSSYLAVNSFFASSLYSQISSGIIIILESYNILTSPSVQITQYISLLLSAFVFLIVIYDYASGKPENMFDIFQMNLMLITPEVLSFSKLNWLNIVNQNSLLEPTRSIQTVLLTGMIVIVGYLTLLFTSRLRLSFELLRKRGADIDEINLAFTKQTTLTIGLIFISVVVTGLFTVLLALTKTSIQSIITGIPSSYLVLGAFSVVLLIVGVTVFINEKQRILKIN